MRGGELLYFTASHLDRNTTESLRKTVKQVFNVGLAQNFKFVP